MTTPHGDAAQDICTSCGFCCDGTMFRFVAFVDRVEMERCSSVGLTTLQGKQFFTQPCTAFDTTVGCKIYPDRPQRCRDFSCQLLGKFQRGEISRALAINTIDTAKQLRLQVLEAARQSADFEQTDLQNAAALISRLRRRLGQRNSSIESRELVDRYRQFRAFLRENFYPPKDSRRRRRKPVIQTSKGDELTSVHDSE
jgi:hypothetical protein